ncbi:MAG: hypothetical protein IKY70_05615 [Bacteroidales bacterium]|nr:hypothetical protein [Bacteroidales bacterium]
MQKSKKIYPLQFEQGTESLDEKAVVAKGFLAENTIDDIIDTYLGDLVGTDVFQYYRGEFPLKISYILPDSNMPLQAHPNDFTALERYDTMGCAKIWYILEAGPDARICLGFNKEIDASSFYEGALENSLEKDLNFVHPQAGDCIFIRPGTPYAAMGKMKIMEVAQNSSVTYHLYNLSGKGETDYQMEVAEAIDVIDYAPFDMDNCYFKKVEGDITIADTSDFIVKMNRLEPAGAGSDRSSVTVNPEEAGSFIALLCLKGAAQARTEDGGLYNFEEGEFILLPALLSEVAISSLQDEGALIVQAYMPKLSDFEDAYLNYYEDEEDYDDGEDDEDEDEGCCCGHHHHH